MLPKTNPEEAHRSTPKKDIGNIMDEAPLFAGLDDFVLSHAVKKETETPPKKKEPRKKKEPAQQAQPATAAETQPQPVRKTRKASAAETTAVLLSVAEMCILLKISRATLIRMDKAGRIPGRIKLGGSVRFHRETVETWLQSLISSHPAP